LAPKVVPGSDVLSIFVAKIVFLTFGLDFQLIFNEKWMKTMMHFFRAPRTFFQTGEPLNLCTGAVF